MGMVLLIVRRKETRYYHNQQNFDGNTYVNSLGRKKTRYYHR